MNGRYRSYFYAVAVASMALFVNSLVERSTEALLFLSCTFGLFSLGEMPIDWSQKMGAWRSFATGRLPITWAGKFAQYVGGLLLIAYFAATIVGFRHF